MQIVKVFSERFKAEMKNSFCDNVSAYAVRNYETKKILKKYFKDEKVW